MIHYHGTPITPRRELLKLAGKCFCVPFSDPRDADTCQQIGQAVMFDNGAFSAHTKGKQLDYLAYCAWLYPRLGQPHWAVVPDRIGGAAEEQRAMLAQWPFPPQLSAPVWHMNLPIDYLLELCDGWPRVCFGSAAEYWQVGSEDWARRADEAFDALDRYHSDHLPWIHMLRGLALSGDRWPFASADSTNLARNFKTYKTCPERMARRIDAVQCPVKWINERATP